MNIEVVKLIPIIFASSCASIKSLYSRCGIVVFCGQRVSITVSNSRIYSRRIHASTKAIIYGIKLMWMKVIYRLKTWCKMMCLEIQVYLRLIYYVAWFMFTLFFVLFLISKCRVNIIFFLQFYRLPFKISESRTLRRIWSVWCLISRKSKIQLDFSSFNVEAIPVLIT